MRTAILYLCILLVLAASNQIPETRNSQEEAALEEDVREPLTAMEALDMVKAVYAANFTKMESDTNGSYYYKLPDAQYYLVYEGQGATEEEYLIHLYEYVADDTEEGIGHFVTYGWYTVKRTTGEITVQS